MDTLAKKIIADLERCRKFTLLPLLFDEVSAARCNRILLLEHANETEGARAPKKDRERDTHTHTPAHIFITDLDQTCSGETYNFLLCPSKGVSLLLFRE